MRLQSYDSVTLRLIISVTYGATCYVSILVITSHYTPYSTLRMTKLLRLQLYDPVTLRTILPNPSPHATWIISPIKFKSATLTPSHVDVTALLSVLSFRLTDRPTSYSIPWSTSKNYIHLPSRNIPSVHSCRGSGSWNISLKILYNMVAIIAAQDPAYHTGRESLKFYILYIDHFETYFRFNIIHGHTAFLKIQC